MAAAARPTAIAWLVPGLNGSGGEHWQTRWSQMRADCAVVEQDEWHDPHPADWTRRLDAVIAESALPVVLVAHSLGCAAVAHWAAGGDSSRVAAALLVAPCDVDRVDACAAIRRFTPMPVAALPFRSTVVASRDDPYSEFARSRCFADRWGSAFVDAGALGHINAASGLGDWHFGQVLLDDLLAATRGERHARAAALRTAAKPAPPCFGI